MALVQQSDNSLLKKVRVCTNIISHLIYQMAFLQVPTLSREVKFCLEVWLFSLVPVISCKIPHSIHRGGKARNEPHVSELRNMR